jgi:hypothetical protein
MSALGAERYRTCSGVNARVWWGKLKEGDHLGEREDNIKMGWEGVYVINVA